MRILFFFMGLPMLFMSFFQVSDALPYAQGVDVIVNGHEVVLTQEENEGVLSQVQELFNHSVTVPALGVVTPQMYEEQIQDGLFVSIKFPGLVKINDLPFDELVFKVEENYCGINLVRGNDGVYDGRCLYVNLENFSTQALHEHLMSIGAVQEALANSHSENL